MRYIGNGWQGSPFAHQGSEMNGGKFQLRCFLAKIKNSPLLLMVAEAGFVQDPTSGLLRKTI